jgi:hypothetical protein
MTNGSSSTTAASVGGTTDRPGSSAGRVARRSRPRWWIVGIALAVVVVVGVAVVLYEVGREPATHVRVILLVSPDDVCGIADEPQALTGYNSTGSAATSVTFKLPNLNSTPCTVENVNTYTPGFALSGISVPFSIPERSDVAVTVSITPPATTYTGNLTLTFR